MSRGTLDPASLSSISPTGFSPSLIRFPKTVRLLIRVPYAVHNPAVHAPRVWALSISLAATLEIEVSFFSSGYLDVSVPPVPFHTLWIGVWILEVCSSGFPHSDISGSMDICSSPKLFAAYHVLHRLSVPSIHPALLMLDLYSWSAAIIALMTGFCVLCFKSN